MNGWMDKMADGTFPLAGSMRGNPACSSAPSLYARSLPLLSNYYRSTLSNLVFFGRRAQILHLLFSWSSVISWLMFIGDLFLIGFLSLHAYRDGKIRPNPRH